MIVGVLSMVFLSPTLLAVGAWLLATPRQSSISRSFPSSSRLLPEFALSPCVGIGMHFSIIRVCFDSSGQCRVIDPLLMPRRPDDSRGLHLLQTTRDADS